MTSQAQPASCSADELRALFLFEKLSDSQLAWLCREGLLSRSLVGSMTVTVRAGQVVDRRVTRTLAAT